MRFRIRNRRVVAAIACLVACLGTYVPAAARPASPAAKEEARALALLERQSCADRGSVPQGSVYVGQFNLPTPTPSPSASPAGIPTPSFMPVTKGNSVPYASPQPSGSPNATPLPIPTPTPNPFDQNQPVMVQRGGDTPPPITPAGVTVTPSPAASANASASPAATLAPNYIAILADKVIGNTTPGQPGDAEGNVHILYGAEEIVGDKAHYDGLRTVTITGHPFIINHARDSVLTADKIEFDTIDQTAKLTNGHGTSSQGVERGLVHFSSPDLHTDASGIGHGLAPSVSTCENPRGGYHITGRNMDVYPGDKIVIYDAILWLGAAAVFWLPKVVIPLRSVVDETQRPKYFPNVGYDQTEGYWIKTNISFGRNQYYYGYYVVNYFTKEGLGLGYIAYYTKRSGHRSATANFYTINNKLVGSRQNNLSLTEVENFSQTLRGNFGLNYTSNYGPFTNIPANTQFQGQIAHTSLHTSQSYSLNRSTVGSQSSSDSVSFTDNRQFNQALSNALSFNLSSSQSTIGASSSSNSSSHFTDLYHYTTSGADYQLTYDKTFAQTPYGINKEPEIQIRPTRFLQHLFFPASANFTVGEYTEPSNGFSSQRADMAFAFGPLTAKVLGGDFQSTVNVNQYAYGTGDLKAAIQQQMSLTSPIGGHVVNTISYSESNYNGPAFVPFQFLDQQPTTNTKNAQDLLRVFNGNTYNLALGFSTSFNGMAQPVSYQFTAQPSARSVLLLGGSFVPGIGQGFYSTNVQFSTPFGHDASLQFLGDINWKLNRRIENKIIYYTKTIGNCYQLQLLYNQSIRLVTVSINILAFPSKSATFNVGSSGPIIPTTFNF
ncbi:MAG TPA: hypothetical protein VNF68_09115 [Candidatus Baltobacteraceae bacterium]|nr:hypothetical protein [Candidatus Baltobacteraceae bacterium]